MLVRRMIILLGFLMLLGILVYFVYTKKPINSHMSGGQKACQDVDVSEIDKRVKIIEDNKVNYASSTKIIFGLSTQGGERINYSVNNDVVLKEGNFFNETGKSESSYYFNHGKVFYFTIKYFEYFTSIYHGGGDAIKKIEVREFYLQDGQKLCFWYLNKQPQPITSDAVQEVNDELNNFIPKL